MAIGSPIIPSGNATVPNSKIVRNLIDASSKARPPFSKYLWAPKGAYFVVSAMLD